LNADELPVTPPPEPCALNENAVIQRLLQEGQRLDREGDTTAAMERYDAVLARTMSAEGPVFADTLRRLGILHHRSGDVDLARELCGRSQVAALRTGDTSLAAEALNALASFELERGELDRAYEMYTQALSLGGARVRARIEHNLGVLANIRGNLEEALAHYDRCVQAHREAGDDRGCASAYHNLGMISADQKRWDEADEYFRRSQRLAELVHDTHLGGLCLLNHTEVHLARRDYTSAQKSAEGALAIFNSLNAQLDKADAYKMLGVVYRETGRVHLAESRLKAAVELALSTKAILSEAEATRELALLYQRLSRNQDALSMLNRAYHLFGKLGAGMDQVDVGTKVENLESTFLAVVHDWGQSIESADAYTHGHCERVASYAVNVARQLGLDEATQTTIRLGAYLHDLGKVKVPHEILSKPARLTPEEFTVIKKHPEWGVELIAGIELPWDVKPIILWHHEKFDGSGYPHGLKGEEIPLASQIICVVDVYDALTTVRSYRGALGHTEAFREMEACRGWWQADVYAAFQEALADVDDGLSVGSAA
jgi:putative nucleotidyltransferase with HDIG domain